MVIDALFDSLCRCFGTVGPTQRNRSSDSNHSHHGEVSTVSSDVKRRTQRLQLDDKEFDNLFQQQKQYQKSPTRQVQPPDLEQAHALARAKLVASTEGARRPKRKSPATKRDEIFRSRNFDTPKSQAAAAGKNQNTFSRFLSTKGVANALCFATPIRDGDEEVEDCSDTNTLNTCEDTITSTLYFDNKYSHIEQKRPPMPLFQSFRVEEDLRRIVATDSHNSLKMISLMKEVNAGADVRLESSSDEDDERAKTPKSSPTRNSLKDVAIAVDKSDPPPPVLQNSSCSTSSSNSCVKEPPKQKPRQKS